MNGRAASRYELRALSAGYSRGSPVLLEINVSLGRGRLVALLGENGSGKSTLLKVLAGLLSPEAGELLLDGQPAAAVPRRAAARLIGYLPQGFTPFFPASALDVVLLGRTPHLGAFSRPTATDRKAARAALEEVDAGALAERDIREISGGERQRVFLARVLAGEPEIYLLDEPTANLDPRHRFLVLDLLMRRAAAGATVVFSTHEVELASLGADDAILLAHGRVVASGPVAESLTDELLGALFGVTARRLAGAGGRALVALVPPGAGPGTL